MYLFIVKKRYLVGFQKLYRVELWYSDFIIVVECCDSILYCFCGSLKNWFWFLSVRGINQYSSSVCILFGTIPKDDLLRLECLHSWLSTISDREPNKLVLVICDEIENNWIGCPWQRQVASSKKCFLSLTMYSSAVLLRCAEIRLP